MSKNKIHAMKYKPETTSKNAFVQCGKLINLNYVSVNIDETTCIKCLKIMKTTLKTHLKELNIGINLIEIQLNMLGVK